MLRKVDADFTFIIDPDTSHGQSTKYYVYMKSGVMYGYYEYDSSNGVHNNGMPFTADNQHNWVYPVRSEEYGMEVWDGHRWVLACEACQEQYREWTAENELLK